MRGNDIAMIFQDPLTSLHPFYKIGWQMVEAVQAHQDLNQEAARKRSIDLLKLVGIPEAERRFDQYPHEFSGGMRQRAMIAMALVNDPKLLIADEPTTALDVTLQAQILKLIERLQAEFQMAVIMITHDLGVIAEVADEVNVMYAGRVVESGTLDQIFYDPQHPYTWGLLGSLTRIDRTRMARLSQIKGQPPSLISPAEGDARSGLAARTRSRSARSCRRSKTAAAEPPISTAAGSRRTRRSRSASSRAARSASRLVSR